MKAGTVLPAAALLCAAGPALAVEATFTADGIRCGNTNFDANELSPSIFGANDYRLRRLLILHARAEDLFARPDNLGCVPGGSELPGCRTIVDWQVLQERPWPTQADPYYIFARTLIRSRDDGMEVESRRAMAHLKCLRQMTAGPAHLNAACAALVEAEAAADATISAGLEKLTSEKNPEENKSKGKKQEEKKDQQTGLMSIVAQANVSHAPPNEAGPLEKAVIFYRCLSESMLRTAPGLCTDRFLAGIKWLKANPEVAAAASKLVDDDIRALVGRPPPGTEQEALETNFAACKNATLHLNATHELIRHEVDHMLPNPFTVCADTSGFAVDKPIELSVSTAAAHQIVWLWPGEPKKIQLELSGKSEPQVIQLAIGGYPRREILRQVARNRGGPLENADIFDFIRQTTAEAKAAVKAGTVKAPSSAVNTLKDFAKQLGNDELQDLLDNVNDLLGKNPSRADFAGKLTKAIEAIKNLASRLPPDAWTVVQPYLPGPEAVRTMTLAELQPVGTALVKLRQNLVATTAETAPPKSSLDTAKAATILCQITSEIVPLVREDVLVRSAVKETKDDRHPYFLSYDFNGGFQVAGPLGGDTSDILESDTLFLAVRNVRPGWSVGVAVGNKTIAQRGLSLVGLPQAPPAAAPAFDQRANESGAQFRAFNPLDVEVQPPGTQILTLGRLAGGARYDVTVCASDSSADDCSQQATSVPISTAANPNTAAIVPSTGAAPTTFTPIHRTIGKNSVTVHSRRFLGVRAGFGLSLIQGAPDLAVVPGVAGLQVREQSWRNEFSLPLLLAVYPGKRDSVELPPKSSFAFVAGLDALHVSSTPRLFGGVVLDLAGLGITAAGVLARDTGPNAPPGTVVSSASAVQMDGYVRGGVLLALTTDLDIFTAVFAKFFNSPNLPTVGGTP
jgi:hypothetical protein